MATKLALVSRGWLPAHVVGTCQTVLPAHMVLQGPALALT